MHNQNIIIDICQYHTIQLSNTMFLVIILYYVNYYHFSIRQYIQIIETIDENTKNLFYTINNTTCTFREYND